MAVKVFSTSIFLEELQMVGCEIWERGDADVEETFNFHPDDPSHPDNMKISRQEAELHRQEIQQLIQQRIAISAGDDTDGRDEEQAKLRTMGEDYIAKNGNTYILTPKGKLVRMIVKGDPDWQFW